MKTLVEKLSIFMSVAALGLLVGACQKDDARAKPVAKATATSPAAAAATAVIPAAAPAQADTTLAATRGGDEGSSCGGGSCGGSCGGGACGGSCGGGSCGGGCGSHGGAEAQATVPANAEWTTLSVVGMRCGGCENRIKKAVGAMEGVLAVKADHKSGEVRIASRPGVAKVREHAGPRIAKLGFHVLSK